MDERLKFIARLMDGEKMAEGVGFEPTREREPPGGFQDRCLKPLGHPSRRSRRGLAEAIKGRKSASRLDHGPPTSGRY
jgi:hypothetical protein